MWFRPQVTNDARTALAERYLADDRLSLTEISYQLGFNALSAFSRWFRQRFGISPTRWRQLARVADEAVSAGTSARRP